MPLPEAIIAVMAPFRPLFTAPTWRKLMTLLTGTLLAHGRRTVCSALRFSGEQMNENWSQYHQVLNRARWSPLAASQCLLLLIVETLVPKHAPITIVIDETLERRWGPQISKRGNYRDSALSSRKRSVSSSGLRWIVMAVVVTPSWTKQPWALPFLVVLSTTPAFSLAAGKRHKTIAMWAGQMVSAVHRWLPDRAICVVGDGAYNCLELGVHCTHRQVSLITPCQFDSVLREPPPPVELRSKGGKPQVVGKRLPRLDHVLIDPATEWQESEISWYGQGKRMVQWCSGTALWYRFGKPPLPLRWVLTRDPSGKKEPKAFFCTDQQCGGLAIILTFMMRWSMESTFEEARAHIGIETQRQWSDVAIERTTPLLLCTYSLVTLIGTHLAASEQIVVEQTAWYRKSTATFHDVLAAVRLHIWKLQSNTTSPHEPAVGLLPRSVLDRLLYAACF
jgi:DDE superfamily endonuclease